MKIIILAGGKATRLPVSARDIPKALVFVDRKPILRRQIEMLASQGFSDIRLSLGYRAQAIIEYLKKEFGRKYEYLVENKPLGTGGAIKYASADVKTDFMVLNGDVFSDLNLQDFRNFHNSLKEKNKIFGLSSIALWRAEDSRDFGLAEMRGNKIKEFLEKPKEKIPGLINAGAYIFSPDIFKNIPKKVFSVENNVFPDLVLQGKLYGFVHQGKWADIGTEQRLAQVNLNFSKISL